MTRVLAEAAKSTKNAADNNREKCQKLTCAKKRMLRFGFSLREILKQKAKHKECGYEKNM